MRFFNLLLLFILRRKNIEEDKKYQIIYADPPWKYKVYSEKGKGRSAENHYPTMSIEDICKLPVNKIASDDCVLFMWMTFPTLKEGLKVIEEWGFKYKTVAFVWVKQNKKTPSLFPATAPASRAATPRVWSRSPCAATIFSSLLTPATTA